MIRKLRAATTGQSRPDSTIEQVEALRARVGDERRRARELGREQQLADTEVTRSRERFVRAISEGREQGQEKLAFEAARMRAAEPWAERISAAEHRVREADRAVTRHIADHFKELSAEMRALDDEALARATRHLDELLASIDELRERADLWAPVMAAAVGPTRDVAGTALQTLRSQLEKIVRAGLPSPTPTALSDGGTHPTSASFEDASKPSMLAGPAVFVDPTLPTRKQAA